VLVDGCGMEGPNGERKHEEGGREGGKEGRKDMTYHLRILHGLVPFLVGVERLLCPGASLLLFRRLGLVETAPAQGPVLFSIVEGDEIRLQLQGVLPVGDDDGVEEGRGGSDKEMHGQTARGYERESHHL